MILKAATTTAAVTPIVAALPSVVAQVIATSIMAQQLQQHHHHHYRLFKEIVIIIQSLTVFTLFVSVLVCITMVRGMVVWILQVCNCLSCLLAWSQTASQNYGPTVVKTQSQPS